MPMTELSSDGLAHDGGHVGGIDLGEQRLYRFPNGFGASVVNSSRITNGAPYELAVLKYHGDGKRDFELTYDTSVTCDVERGDAAEVNGLLAAIATLEPADPTAPA